MEEYQIWPPRRYYVGIFRFESSLLLTYLTLPIVVPSARPSLTPSIIHKVRPTHLQYCCHFVFGRIKTKKIESWAELAEFILSF